MDNADTITEQPQDIPVASPTGGSTIEAQQMVRRVKTYTIVDSEFNCLAFTTITSSLAFFFASLSISVGIDCLISEMSIAADAHLTAGQIAFFYYATRAAFWTGGVFGLITVGAWRFGWSIFRQVKQTSREGRIITG